MRISCKTTGSFLCEIDIEKYYESLKKMGIDITVPITIKLNCRRCHLTEEYAIYPTHYIRTNVYNKVDNKKNK